MSAEAPSFQHVGTAPTGDPPGGDALEAARGVCPLFGVCGGCTTLHLADETAAKVGRLRAAFDAHGLSPPIAEARASPFASRRRATLTAQARGGEAVVGYHARRSHEVIDVPQCPALAPALGAVLPALRAAAVEAATTLGELRLTATSTENGVDVALSTVRRTSQTARSRRRGGKAERVRRPPALAVDAPSVVRVSLDGELLWMLQQPVVRFDGVEVPFPPGAFVQATREAEAALTALVVAGVGDARSVADCFSGLGTFAIPLTRQADVTAFEVSEPALTALRRATACTSGRRALTTHRRNLLAHPLSPDELAPFGAVVFDPPRAGAEGLSRSLAASSVPRVVAVSCEPTTLARDCAILSAGGYKITQVTPVDQFVGTLHIEAVAELRRAPG